MKHIGKYVSYLILAINLLFIALLWLSAYSPHITPDVHPIESCLGLTFPIFILVNCCFLFFWLIVKYKFAILPLVGFLFCYPQIRTYMPINFQSDSIPPKSIKLLSYNVMGFNGLRLEEGENKILNYLKDSEADIICLQEYNATTDRSLLTQRMIDRALKEYKYKNILNVGEKSSSNKIACYSKYPILSSRVLHYESSYNGSVNYEIKIDQDTVTLINNHLESNKLTKEDKVIYEEMIKSPEADKVKNGLRQLIKKLAEASAIRAPQARAIEEEINSSQHKYVIVCGDFNDTPISYVHRIIARNLNDAFTESGRGFGVSYNQNKFFFRIDNILLSKNLKAYNCTVDRSIKESDHYPIWCYISKE
ncbi:endonuclease/exonuclease/phosphatase family protein [Bacteroides graminisolvens]|uniref:endonuclease/exonuclease/phosphatase family protein n=1 Tax=Bacteroides graminisolvens TaxID=477666 RepID=UPI00280B26E6|nr:endonuclease/exonuclease/phosphatase family protein [Bacteroides graminisolvens]HRF92672.1 endonuclease/exonuclease/phosphatase family protein [Bacteroides graminisolvens]